MPAATQEMPAKAAASAELAPIAWRELGALLGVFGVLLIVRLGRYPLWGDELYLVPVGRRPSWGFADQGPLVPLQAHASDLLAPGSAVALRLPVVVLTLASVLLAALIARELGGGRAAQSIAALGYVCTPFAVQQAAALSTFAYDATLVALLCWLLIRWVRTRRDPLLIAAGVVAAVDFQVKWMVPIVWALLALGVLLWGPRVALRRRALWVASGILVAATIPALLWQAGHGWPQLAMPAEIRSEQTSMATGGQLASFARELILTTGPSGILLLVGIWAVARSPRLRPYRFLLPLCVVPLLGVLLLGIRPYYLGDGFALLYGIAAVHLAGLGLGAWLKRGLTAYFAVGLAVVVAAVALLPLPRTWLHTPVIRNGDMAVRAQFFGLHGWGQLVDTVERALADIPGGARADVIMTQNYWQASALDVLARTDLPPIHSPNRGYGYFGPPPDSATRVLYVGGENLAPELAARFGAVVPLARLDDPIGYQGVNHGIRVWYCTAPTRPWSQVWPDLMSLRIDHGNPI
ncbi:ArnT family glycosyltransferase [Nocardia sp. NPDC127579]|uniref:ArnT family glycosyltransferase n=1 Tax=Nocardia sp. NPDC127579 TaxID=3345402 RepID=UPI00362D0C3B